MPDQPRALVRRKPAPDVRCLLAHPIEGGVPALSECGVGGHARADAADERAGGCRRVPGEVGLALARDDTVAARAQPVARQCDDLAPVAAPAEARHDVRRGEAGADDEHSLGGTDGRDPPLVIGIGDQACRVGDAPQLGRQRGHRVRHGEHQKVRLDRRAVRKVDPVALFRPRSGDRLRPRVPDGAACDMRCETRGHILAEDLPLREEVTPEGQRAGRERAALRGEPGHEVLEITAHQRHLRGGHVDPVRGIGGRVGKAGTQRRARLDDQDVGGVCRQASVRGGRRSPPR